MKIIPAKKEHLEVLELRDDESVSISHDPHGLEKAAYLVDISTAATMVYNGVVLGLMGYYELWPGVLEVWVFPSKHVKRYATPYLRTVKRYINGLSKLPGVHRLQTDSISDDLHYGWMTFLGFTQEGHRSQYTADKKDYVMWGKVVHNE